MGKFILYILLACIVFFALAGSLLMGFGKLINVAEPYANDFPNCDNEKCEFIVTSRNVLGSGNYWHYGYDKEYYYSSIVPDSYAAPYIQISKELVTSCSSFNPNDILTWSKCDSKITFTCDFIRLAKNNFENNSMASLNSKIYIKDSNGQYDCNI